MKKILITLLLSSVFNLVKAQPGAALNFDGVNDRVIINNSTLGALTIEFWMRTTQVGLGSTQWWQGTGLVDAEVSGVVNDFGTSLIGNKLAFGIGNPDITLLSASNVNTGNWVHVAAVYTSGGGSYAKLYINGVLEVTNNGVSSNARNTNANINFGRIQSIGANYYNGDLDEVRIWNYTRSQCQIINSMNCELTASEPGLLYYYQFNQGIAAGTNTSIATVTNLMGGNNGNWTPFAKIGASSNFIAPGGVVSGVTCDPLSVNVQGNANDITNGSTSTSTLNATNFGSVCTTGSPVTNIFTLQNNSTSTLAIGSPTITGPNAGLFSVTAIPPSSLAVNASATFAITFSTSTVGTKSATISFTTNNCAFPNYNYALGATVIGSPTITVNSGSICSGNSFIITPSGANTYTITGGNFTVSPLVTTNYTVVGTSSLGCAGTNSAVSTVSVFANPTINVSNAGICLGNSYTINPSGANTYTFTGGGPIVSPTTTTSYSITGTSTQGCVSTNTAVATISINPNPTISVNSGSICIGQSFTIVPSGANTYTFIGGGPVVSPTTTTTYSVNGTNTLGCVSSSPAIVSVSVGALPIITITGNFTICNGSTSTLTASGANTYTWNVGPNTFSIAVSPTTTTNYTVIGTGPNGCSASSIKTVTVKANPTITVNSGAICSGQSFTIVAGGANTYTYSSGPIVSPTITSSYSVTGTSTAGCISSNTAISNVTVNAQPTILVNSGSICSGNSFTIVPSGANTYTYSSGSIVSPTVNTSYSVTGTSTQGCVSSSPAISSVSVNPNPTLSTTTNNTLLCIGSSATLTANGASTYTWNPGGANQSITVSPTVTTNYTVTGTNSFGCQNSAVITQSVSFCTGINQITNSVPELNIYPNPFSNKITIASTESKQTAQIYNALGSLIHNTVIENEKTEINLDEQPKGIYFIRIGLVTKKIIKE